VYKRRNPEKHNNRQAARHDCLPRLLGDGDTKSKKVCGEKKIFRTGLTIVEQPKQDKNLLKRHHEPKEPTKEGPLSLVLFEFPFASVSTVAGATSIWSLW